MILVTGATGNIGRHVVPLLRSRGARVRVLVRDTNKVAHLDAEIERAVGDLTRPETLGPAMQGVDKLFLLIAGERGHEQATHAVDAAKAAGVQHIVVLSSGTVLIPNVKIGQWHREREQIVEASGIPWTFVRPGAFMANALRWAGTIKSQGAVFQPHGAARTAPIHEYDMAEVSAVALTGEGHAGKSYELTGPEPISAAEQVATLARALGRELRFHDVPEEAALEGMRRGGFPAEMADAVMELIRLGRSGREPTVSPWVERLTGRKGRTFDDWARERASDFR